MHRVHCTCTCTCTCPVHLHLSSVQYTSVKEAATGGGCGAAIWTGLQTGGRLLWRPNTWSLLSRHGAAETLLQRLQSSGCSSLLQQEQHCVLQCCSVVYSECTAVCRLCQYSAVLSIINTDSHWPWLLTSGTVFIIQTWWWRVRILSLPPTSPSNLGS